MNHTRPALVFCFFTALCEGFDVQTAGIAAGGIRAEFSASALQLAWFFASSTIGLAIGAVVGGRGSDRVGRKPVLVWSLLLFGACSLLNAAAPGIASLTAARFLTGLGLGGAMPNMIALAAEVSAEHRRKTNVAIVFSAAPVGGLLTSVLGMLTGPAQWRWVFVIGGLLPLAVILTLARQVQESLEFSRQRQAAPAATTWLTVLDRRHAGCSLLLWAGFFLSLLTMYLLLNWLPTLLRGNGFSATQAALAQITLSVGGAASMLAVSQLIESHWRKLTTLVVFSGVPVLITLLSRVNSATGAASMLLVSSLLGAATMGCQAVLYALAPSLYPTLIRGVGVGIAVAAGRVGSICGPLAVLWLTGGGPMSTGMLIKLMPITAVCAASAVTLSFLVKEEPACGARG